MKCFNSRKFSFFDSVYKILGLLVLNVISWIFLSKNEYFVSLTNPLNFFQSSSNLDVQYIFNLVLHSSFHHTLDHLVMLVFLENLYPRWFKILVYFWTISLRDSLFGIVVVMIFPKAFVRSTMNFPSSLLFLMIVYHLSWMNSSLMEISIVKGVWSNKYQDSGKIKWLLNSTESGQRNTRSITE